MAKELQIIYRKTDELIPYDKNPRKNDAAVEPVANSIKEFGFKVPIILDENDVVVAGHTRLKAAKMLGLEEVPTVVADDLTDDQVKAFRLADNKVSEFAGWDFLTLDEELADISIDMGQFGFKDIETPNFDDFFTESEPKEPDQEEQEEIQCPHCKMWFKK